MTRDSTATAATTPPFATTATAAPFATVTTPGPLRAVVIGAGFMGRHWARELAAHPDVTQVGWVDQDTDRIAEALREQQGEQQGAVRTGTDLAAVLAAEQPDLVINSTTPAAHLAVTTAALAHGCAVLTEKPMAMNLAEARALVEVAERTGRLLAVNQDRRQLAGVAALREAARRLAPLTRLEIDFRLPHQAGPYVHLWDEPLLREMAIHLFDAARSVTGADAVSAFGRTYRTPWSWYPGNCSADVLFEMEGDLAFAFTGCWTARSAFTSWSGSWYLEGAGGCARWDGVTAPVLTAARGENEPEPPAVPLPVAIQDSPFPGLAEVLAGFVTALRTGAVPAGECHDNLRSLAMVEAAVASARAGRPLPVER
ncbi:Gfo/Idh/MocA family protein [Streptacidiphilus albus]|uniref:Gfo/Idh/MocA family protein n=1 Tax=Streptacidiphilus albus TaxID=105425 RepID=UPI000AF7691A|nr:Gfo/Idh/MocA family oxidoreductase [Streptacidiphilus albus]